MTQQITAFPVAGLQEASGGSALLFTGAGTLTSLSCASGAFQLFDSAGPPVGKMPLISVGSPNGYSGAPSLSFTNGLWLNATGKNSNIQVGID